MFEKRKHTIFARSKRISKAFTRCGREISIAVKGGGANPDYNSTLRRAIQNARAVNMPKDKILSAIKKASGVDAKDYETVIYEGYGPHGVAVLVETATDNPTRTVANVRLAFRKGGGAMGNANSVAFMFVRQGVFTVNPTGLDLEELELELMDHGLEDMEIEQDDNGDDVIVIRTAFTDFNVMAQALEGMNIEPISSAHDYNPVSTTALGEAETTTVLEMVERLEDDDDVQRVFHTLA